MRWKVCVTTASRNAGNVARCFVAVDLHVADPSAKVAVHSFEMSLPKFKVRLQHLLFFFFLCVCVCVCVCVWPGMLARCACRLLLPLCAHSSRPQMFAQGFREVAASLKTV